MNGSRKGGSVSQREREMTEKKKGEKRRTKGEEIDHQKHINLLILKDLYDKIELG
jgi:hypothetical protein